MSDILDRVPPPKGKRIQYGGDPYQFGELRFPPGEGPFPLLFVIHGGFWKAAYDLQHIGHLCVKLSSAGVVTCNIEYRRVGNPGGGWPGTFLDVASAVDYFGEVLANESRVDIGKVAVIGHSAGGQLALWLGGRHRLPVGSVLSTGQRSRPAAVVSLAGVTDLAGAWEQGLGDGAAGRLLGGSPNHYPERYSQGSPIELLPTGTRQVLIHGREDEIVPISQSERFVERAKALGEEVSLHSLDRIAHFELIDPESRAWDVVVRSTLQVFGIS